MYMVRIVWKCARGKVPECMQVVKGAIAPFPKPTPPVVHAERLWSASLG
jgi:hypothetical protein